MDGIFKEVYGSPSAVSAYQVSYSPPRQQQFRTGVQFQTVNEIHQCEEKFYSSVYTPI
jgi:hypothetical protein